MQILTIVNRPGVAGAVLQTPSSLIDEVHLSQLVILFFKYLQNTFTPKPYELACEVSHVMFHLSHVNCHIMNFYFFQFFLQNGETSWWRVCYQQGPTPSTLEKPQKNSHNICL